MKLLVRNLPRTLSADALRELFEAHGPVQSCNLVMDPKTGLSKGFGFVEMPKPGDAKAAVKTLNGHDISGLKIRVKKAQPKSEQPAEDEVAAKAQVPVSPYKRV